MSYAFDLNFIHCKDEGEAFGIARKATEALWNGIDDFLEDERFYIPALRNGDIPGDVDRFWLDRSMKMRFAFWPEYELLALLGAGWPQTIKRLFKKTVCFQNSCDQDYSFNTWKGICQIFDNIVNLYENSDRLAAISMIEEIPSGIVTDEILREYEDTDDEYLTRSAVYKAVYDTLDLDRWLWGKDSKHFIRFTMSPLDTSEREFDAWIKLEKFVTPLVKHEAEAKAKLAAATPSKYRGKCIFTGETVEGYLVKSNSLLKPDSVFLLPELTSMSYTNESHAFTLGGFREVRKDSVEPVI